MENLDRLCAEYGFRFAEQITEAFNDAKKAESLITKALNVLQEQGLYAFALFCESRGEKEKVGANKLEEITKELLKEGLQVIQGDELLEEIRKEDGLASDLDRLIFSIEVIESSLIYARYHAKALSKESENQKTDDISIS
ncbi:MULTISPECIES: type III-B CRISPR module-associated protein Cmr5 [Thermodesulfovibrio]|uniref:CRISPR type III-B/RAMP module-associated protein Cmr5 n=1 Tax=Thermodesulfovibrio yellowstonii (strain ATCC 51303 / DSM 11347 / YP87) TaxID=289376 RepID=B5YL03_THEYD|nr:MULTISPECIES: hypothetical protein [Thermodesulfovibrio]ACI21634.1 conserved hypothetical protein [Thermodesulfovibrio yellowstonii DSM 11347]MDI6864139.1 hypothetical protein [Thermodesulfovibrio yellowstonii]